MKKLMAIATLAMAAQSFAGIDGIYGPDDRKDVYQVSNTLHRTLAKSTAGMVANSMFAKASAPNTFNLQGSRTLGESENLCSGEKFTNQFLAPMCSGFLVGPDTLVTAGHCFKSIPKSKTENLTPEEVCKYFAWVFEYEQKTATSDPTKNIPLSNIALCKSVAFAQLDTSFDFAIIKLDRKVVGRAPLKYRAAGKIPDSTKLVVIGQPNGLPTKISANGKITLNSEPTRFSTNLDTFHGNSGSAVFDATTGTVEGILIMGKTDYVPSIKGNEKSCKVVNKCDDNANNCSAGLEGRTILKGEVVLRIQPLAALIQKTVLAK